MGVLAWFVLGAFLSSVYSSGERSKRAAVPIAELVKHSIDVAVRELEHKKVLEEKLFKEGKDTLAASGDYMWHHSRFMAIQDPTKFEQLNYKAYTVLRAVKEFEKVSGIPLAAMKQDANIISIWKKVIEPHCQCPQPTCNPVSVYRTMDGSCNNAKNIRWGAANTPQIRFLPAAYIDGVNGPRTVGVTGAPLPSARSVSNCIHNSKKATYISDRLTIMFMTWGQFIDHDFAGTPVTKGFNNSDIKCCDNDPTTTDLRGSCMPISIPKDDTFFDYHCMNFVRSAATPNQYCTPEWRNQINQHTSYIDASMVYGATEEKSHELRAHYGGFLKMLPGGLMPKTSKKTCMPQDKKEYCFAAGDDRNMVVPSLTYAHLLFIREHNRIAAKLFKLNPHWTDEKCFQESRKIIIALIQQITFLEYLPLVLGPQCLEKYKLKIKSNDYDTVYDPSVDATTSNVFCAAAFRFGHSQIPNHQAFAGENGIIKGVLPIEQTFNRPTLIQRENGRGYDGVGRWMVNDVQAKDDRFFDDGVRNKLFLDKKGKSFDLSSLNIQRGRDHGLPSYNAWRVWCGLSPAQHFEVAPGGLVDVDPEAANKFKKLYSHPDDIDLFPAAMSERKLPGALVGPTFGCLIAKQFHNFRVGDRYWYENEFVNIGFTREQLHQIKQIRLSSVMCANTKIRALQYNAFSVPSLQNPRLPCELFPQIDLRYWQENGHYGGYVPGLYDARNLSRVPLNPVPFWMASAYNNMLHFPDIYHKHIAKISKKRKVY